MEQNWSKKIEDILKVGQPLFNTGINNWALTKIEALAALEELYSMSIAILGGDVYEIKEGILQSNYDNWYCDLSPEESQNDFINRSYKKAKAYIENYISKEPDKIYFVLVPDA